MSADGEIGRLDGLLLVGGLIAFNALVIRAARQERLRPAQEAELVEAERVEPPIQPWRELLLAALGIILLVVGAQFLVQGAVAIAVAFNVSELVIGLTLVAVGTSLPELVTTIVAARKRNEDILFSNVVGSNLFNLLGILGVTALVLPVPVSDQVIRTEMPVMLAFAAALVFLGWRGAVRRWSGVLLLAAYVLYVAVSVLGTG